MILDLTVMPVQHRPPIPDRGGLQTAGDRRVDLITVANALHFMNPASVFADARELLRPGGGIAIISHGVPLWLADTPWARSAARHPARVGQRSGSR